MDVLVIDHEFAIDILQGGRKKDKLYEEKHRFIILWRSGFFRDTVYRKFT